MEFSITPGSPDRPRRLISRAMPYEMFVEINTPPTPEYVPYVPSMRLHDFGAKLVFNKTPAEKCQERPYLSLPWKGNVWPHPIHPRQLPTTPRLPPITTPTTLHATTTTLHHTLDLSLPPAPATTFRTTPTSPALDPPVTVSIGKFPPKGMPAIPEILLPVYKFRAGEDDTTAVFVKGECGRVVECEVPRFCLAVGGTGMGRDSEMKKVVDGWVGEGAVEWGRKVMALALLRECLRDDHIVAINRLLIGTVHNTVFLLASLLGHPYLIGSPPIPTLLPPLSPYPPHKPVPPVMLSQLHTLLARRLTFHHRTLDYVYHTITTLSSPRRRADYSVLFGTVCSCAYIFSKALDHVAGLAYLHDDLSELITYHKTVDAAMKKMINLFADWARSFPGDIYEDATIWGANDFVYPAVEALKGIARGAEKEMGDHGETACLGGAVAMRWVRCVVPVVPEYYGGWEMGEAAAKEFVEEWKERQRFEMMRVGY